VGVDLDNFDAVMKGMKPNASYRVANALSAEGGEFGINVEFSSIEDFSPEAVVQQVEPLRRLLEVRTRLSDLRNKISGNEKLEDVLGEVLSNTEQLKKLGQELATTEE
jgi:type VI secretion system protein ImpB